MEPVLIVYLQNCQHPQWVYSGGDLDELIVELKPSGLLWIGKEDPEAGEKKRQLLACFPPGGWAGYVFDHVPTQVAMKARGEGSRIATPG